MPLAPLCAAFGDSGRERQAREFGKTLHAETVKQFWSKERKLFVNNLPWLKEEGNIRMCDRSLATSVLFDQCPDGDSSAAVQTLAECPPEMGFSYPANAVWRLWAASRGRAD